MAKTKIEPNEISWPSDWRSKPATAWVILDAQNQIKVIDRLEWQAWHSFTRGFPSDEEARRAFESIGYRAVEVQLVVVEKGDQ